jgi:hypothetical protein
MAIHTMEWGSLLPECFIVVDFFLNLFNKSGKTQKGGIGLKDDSRKQFLINSEHIRRPDCQVSR